MLNSCLSRFEGRFTFPKRKFSHVTRGKRASERKENATSPNTDQQRTTLMMLRMMIRAPALLGARCGLKPLATRHTSTVSVLGKDHPRDQLTNITPSILARMNANLLNQDSHPLAILLVI